MKIRLLLVFLFMVFLCAANISPAQQELHCNRAIRKDNKSCKKDCKIHKKMFHDRPYKASKKHFKSDKKECKAEGKEYKHLVTPNHDGPAAE